MQGSLPPMHDDAPPQPSGRPHGQRFKSVRKPRSATPILGEKSGPDPIRRNADTLSLLSTVCAPAISDFAFWQPASTCRGPSPALFNHLATGSPGENPGPLRGIIEGFIIFNYSKLCALPMVSRLINPSCIILLLINSRSWVMICNHKHIR